MDTSVASSSNKSATRTIAATNTFSLQVSEAINVRHENAKK